MEFKNFSELSPTSCASLIVRDVIQEGISQGWTGNTNDLMPLRKLLHKIKLQDISDTRGFYHFKKENKL